MVEPGTQIGSYRIERLLGQGGFGVVYVGVDVRLGRRAAIKQLHPELSGNREIVERFFNEAKAAASINHPGIVEIFDVGWHTDGSAYFAMKMLDGESLADRIRASGPMPIPVATTIARQISSALVAAHGTGIVHRDLKPDNVILVPDEETAIGVRAIVLDFGIAKLSGTDSTTQTKTGVVMGTPLYMSPEQCHGASAVDQRTDIYALGCILFELLTGRPPFVGEGAGQILGMHQYVEPPALRGIRPDAPPELESLIARMLAKQPGQRLSTMSELAAALQTFGAARSMTHSVPTHPVFAPMPPVTTLSEGRGQVDQPPRTRRTLAIAAAGIVVAGGIVAVIAATSGSNGATNDLPDAGSSVVVGTRGVPDAPIDSEYQIEPPPPPPPTGSDRAGSDVGKGRISVSSKQTFDESTLTTEAVVSKIQMVYMAGIKRCYRNYLKKEATARGKLILNLTVTESGATTPAKADFAAPELADCVTGQMSGWRFPAPKDKDGERTTAGFAITLQLTPE